MTTINRRQLAKGAAWSVPVVVAAAAAPAASASPTGFDVQVVGSCISLDTIGQSPLFYIYAHNADVPAGKPYTVTYSSTLTGTDIRDFNLGSSVIGNVQVAADGHSATFTYDIAIPAGTNRQIYLNHSVGPGVSASLTYTGGDTDPSDDTGSMVTISQGGITTCTGN